MSASALWMNAGPGVTVGTATIAASTDTFTIAGHTLVDQDQVIVSVLTGGAVGVLEEDVPYFVRDAATDTFQLAPSPGAPPMAFAADGGATVERVASVYPARKIRQAHGGLLAKARGAGDIGRYGARAGVLRNTSVAEVTLSGSTLSIGDLNAVVNPTAGGTQGGPYLVALDAHTQTVDAADAQTRLDILILEVLDDGEDLQGEWLVRTRIVKGTPSGTPTAPATPDGTLRLAVITVPSVGAATLDYSPDYTVAAGGILPIADAARRPTVVRRPGDYIDVDSTGTLERWNGAAYEVVARRGIPVSGWTPIGNGTRAAGAGDWSIDVTAGGKFPAGTFDRLRLTIRGDLDADGTIRIRVNDDSAAGLHRTGMLVWNATGAAVSNTHADGTTWYLADWGTVATCTATVEIIHTGGTNLLSYQAEGGRHSSSASSHRWSKSWGSLTSSRLVSTIHVRPFTAGANLIGDGADWWLEGYRK